MKQRDPQHILESCRRAAQRHGQWENHWRDCYNHTLPHHSAAKATHGAKRYGNIYDGTAADAVDQLAASLLSHLTPPWSRWFGLKAGAYSDESERSAIAQTLEKTTTAIQSHFEMSNFSVEMHQCYLDLVIGGTACLLFEESPVGDSSAFRFSAVPLFESILEEDEKGRLSTTYRRRKLGAAAIKRLYPNAVLDPQMEKESRTNGDERHHVIEAVWPENEYYQHATILEHGDKDGGTTILSQGVFKESPFINFRWMKAPGEIYGRSPVMKCLPDIKTANKVVELILKNASIAVTGIWQAEDDGVLNPANIRLVPGEIIPKAIGSRGLSPLPSPGRFDVSNIILNDLRGRIRHALLTDQLSPPQSPRMSATEILERSQEVARILGATYGRLQTELLTPLVKRAVSILRRRGEIPDFIIDGRNIDLQYHSPLARNQNRNDIQDTILWLETAQRAGEKGLEAVDFPAAMRWLGKALGVSSDLIRENDTIPPAPEDIQSPRQPTKAEGSAQPPMGTHDIGQDVTHDMARLLADDKTGRSIVDALTHSQAQNGAQNGAAQKTPTGEG